MLSGATWRASAIVGTAVLRIVVSSDSIKNATAISHGTRRLLEAASEGCEEGTPFGLGELKFVGPGCIGLPNCATESSFREKPIVADANPDFVETHGAYLLREFRVPSISARKARGFPRRTGFSLLALAFCVKLLGRRFMSNKRMVARSVFLSRLNWDTTADGERAGESRDNYRIAFSI